MPRGVGDRLAAMPRFRRWAAAASLGWAVLVLAYGAGFLSVAAGRRRAGRSFSTRCSSSGAGAAAPRCLARGLARRGARAPARDRRGPGRGHGAPRRRPCLDPRGARAADAGDLARGDPPRGAERGHRARARTIRCRSTGCSPARRGSRWRCRSSPCAARGAGARAAAVAEAPRPRRRRAAPRGAGAEPPSPRCRSCRRRRPRRARTGPTWSARSTSRATPRTGEGFRALKAALRHHGLAQTLQAAEDVLNLLSQEGVFVDELPVAPFDAGAWRRFMAGGAGPSHRPRRDQRRPRPRCGARADAADSIFRDSALFFQRRFDGVLGEFASGASDADSRSSPARAPAAPS